MAASLRRNFSWALVGNVCYAGAQFVALMVLAKLGSAEIVGRYSYGLAVSGPVVLLFNLKLRQVQATDQADEYRFADYAGLRLISAPLSLLVVAAIAFAVADARRSAWIIVAVGLAKAFEALSDVAHGQFLRHERNDTMARSQIARGIGVVAAMAIGLGLFDSLLAAVGLQVLIWGAASLADLEAARRLEPDADRWRPRFDPATLRRLSWTALPLGVVVLMGSLQLNVPRYAVEAWHGEAALGVFAALAYLLVAQGTVLGAMGLVASPRLARHWTRREHGRFVRLLTGMVLGGTGLGLVGVGIAQLAGGPILTLLFTEEYAAYDHVLVRLMIASALSAAYLFLGTGINAMRRFTLQVPVHLISLVTVSALCLLWVPEGGALGAANALIGTSAVTLAVYLTATIRLLMEPRPDPVAT